MQTINGKFIQNLPETRGESQRGTWVRGGFVIEHGDEYPRKVAFSTFGEDRVNQHKDIPAGAHVQVRFVPESREYNNKWYTDLRAIAIYPLAATTPAATSAPAPGAGAIQYPASFQNMPPATPANTMPDDPDNDLPF